MSRANPTRLSSLKGIEKDVSEKKFNIYIAPWRPKTQRRLEDRELNQARSKPDTVDRPVRTAHVFVHHYNSTHYCNTETVFIYIPLPFLPFGDDPFRHSLRPENASNTGESQQELLWIQNRGVLVLIRVSTVPVCVAVLTPFFYLSFLSVSFPYQPVIFS